MKKFVEKIYLGKGFSIILNKSESNIAIYRGQYDDFFINSFTTEHNLNLDEKVDELFSEFLNISAYASVEHGIVKKNTSAIIFVKVNDVKTFVNEHKKTIFAIEEETSNFRMYVLPYSIEQNDLTFLLDDDLTAINFKKLDKFIKDENKFIQYEKDIYSSNLYNFIVQLYIKMQFLYLEADDEKNLVFEEYIDNALKIKNGENKDKFKNMLEKVMDDGEFLKLVDSSWDIKCEEIDKFIKYYRGE